ncbi:MAG: 30S ribosome-binding factor RbfA [Verrucomicrobiota bacterium]|nr:30S ribosome-binding factor RbfA [Verrucomicrobiota bacterium]
MKANRITRINALLKREIGNLLFQIMGEEEFDLSAVTVTQVSVGRDLRDAVVRVSIRDHEAERGRMLRLLAKRRAEIQAAINRNVALKYTPRLQFRLDTSVEKGDRILGLLADMEKASAHGAAEP